MPAKKKIAAKAPVSDSCPFAPHELRLENPAEGDWGQEKNKGGGFPLSQEEKEEQQLREQPWGTMRVTSRAVAAVSDLARRVRAAGAPGDVDSLLAIIGTAIRALEQSPHSGELMRRSVEWPALVPGGLISTPIWKGWADAFSLRKIGTDNELIQNLPQKGKVKYSPGKPAVFASKIIEFLEECRGDSSPLLEQLEASKEIERAPEWAILARNLAPFSVESVKDWRDAGLAVMGSQADWTFWMRFFPDRIQTAETRAQKKADKGMQYGAGGAVSIDSATAKNLVSGALLDGLTAILQSPD